VRETQRKELLIEVGRRKMNTFVGKMMRAVSEGLMRRASRTGRRYKRDFPGTWSRRSERREEREWRIRPLAVDVETMTWRD
jgi:hypothetical protein